MNTCEHDAKIFKIRGTETPPEKRRVRLNGKCYDLYVVFKGIHDQFNNFVRPKLTYDMYKEISRNYLSFVKSVDTVRISSFVKFLLSRVEEEDSELIEILKTPKEEFELFMDDMIRYLTDHGFEYVLTKVDVFSDGLVSVIGYWHRSEDELLDGRKVTFPKSARTLKRKFCHVTAELIMDHVRSVLKQRNMLKSFEALLDDTKQLALQRRLASGHFFCVQDELAGSLNLTDDRRVRSEIEACLQFLPREYSFNFLSSHQRITYDDLAPATRVQKEDGGTKTKLQAKHRDTVGSPNSRRADHHEEESFTLNTRTDEFEVDETTDRSEKRVQEDDREHPRIGRLFETDKNIHDRRSNDTHERMNHRLDGTIRPFFPIQESEDDMHTMNNRSYTDRRRSPAMNIVSPLTPHATTPRERYDRPPHHSPQPRGHRYVQHSPSNAAYDSHSVMQRRHDEDRNHRVDRERSHLGQIHNDRERQYDQQRFTREAEAIERSYAYDHRLPRST